ncbi:replicative DNA helicase [Paenibacillus humicus]|uniref:replicative DNA helicase n=1 Tax=Paenibacillus humicus TaxID=412861 RepID=UPI000FDA71A9|nr:replicative DNA helicase [Paenibacillus humicus]
MNEQDYPFPPDYEDNTPRDSDAEMAVIGSVLIDPAAYDVVSAKLGPGKFFHDEHKRIFRAMGELAKNGHPIDMLTLVSLLQDKEELDDVGGVNKIAQMASTVPTASNAGYYADRVNEKYMQREAIEIARELLKLATSGQDVAQFAAAAEKKISKLTEEAVQERPFTTMKQALGQVWEESEERYNNRNNNRGITGTPTGFTDLDKMTAGLQKQDLIIVAARPSVGKTALALNIAQHVGVKAKETVAIFSLEMSAKQLTARMISSQSNMDAEKLKTGLFEGDDWERMGFAVGVLSQARIFIDDTPGITVREIRNKCRQLKKEHGLGLILIDYLQLIQGMGSGGLSNRQQEVSDISRTLKQIARELDVPVIALSQLSRGVEQRQDKRPMMSDLRESGSIEQDADIVAFLYRDDYYKKQDSDKKNIIEIIIAKQRNGPVGTVELAFLKNYGKMVNLDRQTVPEDHDPNW